MNAKELADMLRRDADHIESFHGAVNPSYLRAMAGVAELLVPKYRPPQPSDDGKWCFLEEFHDELPNLYKIVQHDDGSWWYSESPRIKRSLLTGNVWPCERPEGTE